MVGPPARAVRCMRLCVLLLLASLAAGCGHWRPARRADHEPEAALEPEPPAGEARAPGSQPASSRPAIADKAGLVALQRWTHECYEAGLRHDPIFAKGGRLLVRWQADRLGRLLSMDFVVDSFRGWAINAAGETLADCVVAAARSASITWSMSGTAPLRLNPIP